MDKQITVLLADDHAMVREGLHALLRAESDIKVIGMAENGREAVKMVAILKPDIVIMDIAMPLLNGLESTKQIIKSKSKSKVLMLSAHSDDAYVKQAMSVGASGFLIKQTAAHILPVAIREIHNGSEFYSPTISKRLAQQRYRDKLWGGEKPPELSSRETEVLQLVAEGKANKQTAAELNISIKTVEKHRQSLMNKLNIHDTAGLTRHAIAVGVIESRVQVTIIE